MVYLKQIYNPSCYREVSVYTFEGSSDEGGSDIPLFAIDYTIQFINTFV